MIRLDQHDLLFGGRSAEHEVSILSARSVAKPRRRSASPSRRSASTSDGRFRRRRSERASTGRRGRRRHTGDASSPSRPGPPGAKVDVVFPLIHGTGGEDGSLQGYLEMLGLPYVGSGVTASAVGMDKVHMKQAFAAAKLPLVDYVRGARARMAATSASASRAPSPTRCGCRTSSSRPTAARRSA